MFLKSLGHETLKSDEHSSSQERLLTDTISETRDGEQRRKWRAGVTFTVLNIMICLVSVGIVSYLVKSQDSHVVAHSFGLQDETIFSSLNLERLLPPRNKSRFSTPEVSSIYLQPPSKEVDAAWNELSVEGYEMTTISGADARALGRDPKLLAKVPSSWNLGEDRYFAQVHVFHLIHCLDEVRKQVYWDHYYPDKVQLSEEFFNHKKHCLHMLLENLVCQASSEVITHNWRDTYHVPIADFDPQPRQCRNFDSLWEWAHENAIDTYRTKWAELQVPKDASILPAPTPRLY